MRDSHGDGHLGEEDVWFFSPKMLGRNTTMLVKVPAAIATPTTLGTLHGAIPGLVGILLAVVVDAPTTTTALKPPACPRRAAIPSSTIH